MPKNLIPTISTFFALNALLFSAPGDYWLQMHGLFSWELDIDHDQDGSTSRNEYHAGSDPWDASSVPTSIDEGLSIDNVALSWAAREGIRYGVDSSADLLIWNATGLETVGDGGTASVLLQFDGEREFFRLGYLEPLDADGDNLSDLEELFLGTDSSDSDTDNDLLEDGTEVLETLTDPLVPNVSSGTIRGAVLDDPDKDGDLSDGVAIEAAKVFLDANYNGVHDLGERITETAADGTYEFLHVTPGLYHVRQELPAPNIQTFPQAGQTPTFDMLPDEVVNYTHAAPGVGDFDVPYGENASDWPAQWGKIETLAGNAEPVSVDLVLNPIGVRNRVPNIQTYFGSEFLTLPTDASITVRFEEPIIDGPGPDFLVYSITNQGNAIEACEIRIGPTAADLDAIGIFSQSLSIIPIDLADHNYIGPLSHVQLISQNNGGGWMGFELTGFEALNIAPPDPAAHVVNVTASEVFDDRDFGRFFQDLPPTVILNVVDQSPATQRLRVGENITAKLSVFDDLGIASKSLSFNGQPVALDSNDEATIALSNPGAGILTATATDTGGQEKANTTRIYILNADGTFPFDPNQIGPNSSSSATAPEVRILAPGVGSVLDVDTQLIAEITGTPAPTSWTVEYAPVDLIDPYDLTTPDPDYIQIASGSGEVFSTPVGTLPLSSLADGIYFVRVCASNSAIQNACYGQVVAKNVAQEDLRPQVSITSPAEGTEVSVSVEIVGTIMSARPLREWYVEIARADLVDLNNINAGSADWKRIASGTNQIESDAVIASIDATALKNNGYVARVVAWNNIGLGWAEPIRFDVTGEAKLGRVRLEFTDVSIDLAGFPLKFTRVYDSLRAGESRELGFGWSLALQDPDIRETVPDTGSFGLFGSTPFREGTRVYINAPTGNRLGFTFKPEPVANSAFGTVYKAHFEPDPGVYHTLEIPEGDLGFLRLESSGEVSLFFFNLPYNPEKYVLIEPDGNRYIYHEDRGFLQAEDLNGNKLIFNSDGIDHSSGLGITFVRDGQGRITQIADPENRQWVFTYDADGNLATVTDPDSNTTTYTYHNSPAHYLDTITDPLGRMPVRYEYDPVTGRVVAMIDEQGNREELSFDPGSFSGSITDRRGNVTMIEYDERGNVIREVDQKGNVTAWEYGDPSNPDRETRMIDANGEEWKYQYNSMGQLTRFIPPLSTFGNNQIRLTYNEMGKPISRKELDGAVITAAYDERGNILENIRHDAPPVRVTRNDAGQIHRILSGNSHEVALQYDTHGLPTGLRDNVGFQIAYDVDKTGFGKSVSDANGNGYDFTYDSRGIPVQQTDPNGNSQVTVENPDGSFTRTDRNGNATRFTLNTRGALMEATLPDGGEIAASYDEEDNLKTLTDPGGNVTSFAYDSENIPNGFTDAAGNSASVDYDAFGNVIEIVDRNGKRRTFEYDANRRITHERWHDSEGTVIREIVFSYQAAWGLQRIDDSSGGTTTTIKIGGRLPRPNRVTYEFPGQTSFNIAYNWANGGEQLPAPRSVTLNRGLAFVGRNVSTYFANRLMEISLQHPDQTGNRLEFHYNADGSVRLHERYTSLGQSSDHSQSSFTYDGLGRLATIRHEDTGGNLIHPNAELTYARDAGARITSISHAGNAAALSYDSRDQLVGVTHSNPSYADETYAYDESGSRSSSHLQTTAATLAAGNRVTAIGSFTYQHDAEGNTTRRTNTTTNEETNFDYDHRNRLIKATVHPANGAPASDTYEFEYDFQDRLISREINGTKTWILNDRNMPFAEFADGANVPNAMFLYSLDRLDDFHMVWREGIGERWFIKDHLGSVRGTLDDSGSFLSWVEYDSFGNIQGPTPAGIDAIRFAGRFYLEDLGLYENRLRYYDPALGRFTQEDPLRFEGGDLNLYRYVGNNPINLTDPTGTTAAISYGMLADLVTFYLNGLCKFGVCVGNLWKGVVEASVNLNPPTLPGKQCTIDLLGLDDDGGGAGGAVLNFAIDQLKPGPVSNAETVKGLVEECGKLSFTMSGLSGGSPGGAGGGN